MSKFKLSAKKTEERINLTVSVSTFLHNQIVELTSITGISRNQVVAQMIQYALDNMDEANNDTTAE